jgi:hypothetical protein
MEFAKERLPSPESTNVELTIGARFELDCEAVCYDRRVIEHVLATSLAGQQYSRRCRIDLKRRIAPNFEVAGSCRTSSNKRAPACERRRAKLGGQRRFFCETPEDQLNG